VLRRKGKMNTTENALSRPLERIVWVGGEYLKNTGIAAGGYYDPRKTLKSKVTYPLPYKKKSKTRKKWAAEGVW